ncbi:unnamed protein product [Citrullus colocynthis]|uniref:Uncharacterized protein n=1 Tax=Citrullus colocynthis TaxID=252529 RepID=A0ABP0Y6R0_9ROSI
MMGKEFCFKVQCFNISTMLEMSLAEFGFCFPIFLGLSSSSKQARFSLVFLAYSCPCSIRLHAYSFIPTPLFPSSPLFLQHHIAFLINLFVPPQFYDFSLVVRKFPFC